jgi:hypothetical protein
MLHVARAGVLGNVRRDLAAPEAIYAPQHDLANRVESPAFVRARTLGWAVVDGQAQFLVILAVAAFLGRA